MRKTAKSKVGLKETKPLRTNWGEILEKSVPRVPDSRVMRSGFQPRKMPTTKAWTN
jgi:hypothetical protein